MLSSLWSCRSTFRRVVALLSWVCPLTRAARGYGAAADFLLIRGTERLLSLPLDSSDASVTSRFDRVSCKTQLQSTPSASLASYPRPSAGHGVLTSALRTVDAREIRNFTRRAPNHLLAKTDPRKNAVPAAPFKIYMPCSGAHEICRTCVAALRKADGAIQCPKCREDATGAVNPNRGLIAALRLTRRS